MSRIIQAIMLTVFLTGCGNWSSVYRDFSVDDGVGAMVDIKQRAVIASAETSKVRVCAEPSPDALSAHAAQLSTEANVSDEIAGQFAAALQESAAFVGLRTQSIQLLRDSMYRLCEGFLSGALDQAQYEILMRRYQKFMVALLGIEQLTGVVRVPTVTINTEGSAEAARSIASLRDEMASIDSKISDLNAENMTLENEKNKPGATENLKKENDALIAKNKELIAGYEGDREYIEKGIKSAQGLTARGSATAVVSNIGILPPRSDSHIQAVVEAVKEIVLKVVNTDDLGQVCFAYLRYGKGQGEETTVDRKLASICEGYFKNLNDFIEERGKAISLIISKAGEMQLNFEQLKEFAKLLKEPLVGVDSTGGLLKLRGPMMMQYNFPVISPVDEAR